MNIHQTTRKFPRNRFAWWRAQEEKKIKFDSNRTFLSLFSCLFVPPLLPRRHSTRAKTMGLIWRSTLRQRMRMYRELSYPKQETLKKRLGEDFVQKVFSQHYFLSYNIHQYNQKVFE